MLAGIVKNVVFFFNKTWIKSYRNMNKSAVYFTGVMMLIAITGCNQKKQVQPQNEKPVMSLTKELFGTIDGREIYLFNLQNQNGMIIKITNYGGIITSIVVPDRDGNFDDVVLGYDSLSGYLRDTPYFGAIVGRYANRIAKGKFTLDGQEYNLAVNNGPNHLHGGITGFDKVIWNPEEITTNEEVSLKLSYLSRDGEEGYPGNLEVTIIYSLNNKNELIIGYSAKADKPTPVNLSHHSYFNLAGTTGRDILDQFLFIDADRFTVVDETLIPTGELREVTGAMDFRTPSAVGSRIADVSGGYDHNYVLNNKGGFARVAELSDPVTGRIMEVFTDEPGLQFYSGNFLDGTITGKGGIVYRKHFALCLETQHFPDSPNQSSFPNTILRPGDQYQQKTIYRFGIK